MNQDITKDMQAILVGDDFRIEREDATIKRLGSSDTPRFIPGVRIYLRGESGRWVKRSWLVANKENGAETIHQALRDWVNALDGVAKGLGE